MKSLSNIVMSFLLLLSGIAFAQPSAAPFALASNITSNKSKGSNQLIAATRGDTFMLLVLESGTVHTTSVVNASDGTPCATCTFLGGVSNGSINRVEAWHDSVGAGPLQFNLSGSTKALATSYALSGVGGFLNLNTATGFNNPQLITTNVTNAGDLVMVGFARQGSGGLGAVSGCTIDQSFGSIVTKGSLDQVMSETGASGNQPAGALSCSVNSNSFQGAQLGSAWAALAIELTP